MWTGSENGGIYLSDTLFSLSFNCQTLGNQSAICYVSKSLRHNRLGHPTDQAIDVIQSNPNFTIDSHISPCEICHKAKQTREPFPFSANLTTSVGEIVHLDLWGPYKVVSKDGFIYFLTIVDDYTKAIMV
nr:ribonuclease H-like domain-containing protein [Tanacetum cinerariifolium]